MHLPELCQNLFPSQPVLYYFTNNLTYTRVAIYRLFVTNNLYCECHARWIKLDKWITLRFEVGGQIAVATGHLIIWVTTSWAARDPGAYQYTHETFGMQRHKCKWFFKRYFPQKNQLHVHTRVKRILNWNKRSVYTGPLIKFTFSEFDSYQFFSLLNYY